MRHNKRLLYVCGGTGGHIYPCIALAQYMKGYEPCFIGSRSSLDRNLITKYGFRFLGVLTSSWNPFLILMGVFHSLFYLLLLRPSMVVLSGGYVSFPVLISATLLRFPVVILEQNVVPGRVNKWGAFLGYKVLLSFEATSRYLATKKTIYTGNPIRLTYPKDISGSLDSLTWAAGKCLLVVGGSQGAFALNDFVLNNKSAIYNAGFTIIHITGMAYYNKYYDTAKPMCVESNSQGAVINLTLPYCDEMDALYALSDCVFARSGATTIAELLYFNKPAVLVPYPFSTDNHQHLNAREFVRLGTGVVIDQKELIMRRFLDSISKVTKDSPPCSISKNPVSEVSKEILEILS